AVDERVAARTRTEPEHGLSPRELEVLRLLAAGNSNPEIAEALFVSRATARTHVENILGKLGVHSRAEAVDLAHRLGLLGQDEPPPTYPPARYAPYVSPPLVQLHSGIGQMPDSCCPAQSQDGSVPGNGKGVGPTSRTGQRRRTEDARRSAPPHAPRR